MTDARPSRWNRLVAFWDARETGESMALLRIGAGLTVFATMVLLIYREIPDVIWVDFKDGGYRSLGAGQHLVRRLGGPSPGLTWTLVWTACISSVFVTLGLFGRVSIFVLLVSYLNLHRLNGETSGSSDIVITNALWMLLLTRATVTWSVDCYIKNRRWSSDELITAWPRYLLILQIVLLYGTTGIQKVSAYWLPIGGWSALYYILQQPTWGRFDHSWAAYVFPLTQIGTLVTWLWEAGAPLLLLVLYYRNTADRPGRLRRWFNRWDLRWVWAVIGITMHLMILVFMVVGPFSPITLSLYFCVFRPAEWRAWLGKLGQRLGRGSNAPAVDEDPA